MVILIIAAVILAAPFVIRWYLRLATRSAVHAQEAWPLMERHAHVLLEDRRLDPRIGDLVETVALHVGDGRLTRSFLINILFWRKRRPDAHLTAVLTALNGEQEKQFLHFLVAALFFDSLTAPISGMLLRKLIYWLAATAKDRSAPVSRSQVEPVMSAAGRMCSV